MAKAYLITGNKDKLAEAKRLLGFDVNHIQLDLDELQGLDAEKIAEHKARQGFKETGKPIIVWDQSIYISALNDFPGPLIKWFWTSVTLEKICQIAALLGDNKIKAQSILTFYDGSEMKSFIGEASGTLPDVPRGDKGFGWDPIFIPNGPTLTYAEMDVSDPLFHIHNQDFQELVQFLTERGYNLEATNS